ncbi:MAG: hypothetical protein QNJ49_09160 [Mastigocoleus sp. MO_167.B18]|nr:hypothetical protein [Mastigocoleus sp. MO_167.B18]
MRKNTKYDYILPVYGWLLICYISVGLFSCSNINFTDITGIGADITPIKELTPQADQTTVYVKGKVTKQVPLLKNERLYQLDDSTGKVWILTHKTNWKVGQEVQTKGKIKYKNIPIADKDFSDLYLEAK